MKLTWGPVFSGIRPKVDNRLLPDGNAQVAENTNTEHGGLYPVEDILDIMALSKSSVKSIYRFGQAINSATQYWFHWTTDVDVVKGPIANDTTERTYWTGDGVPKYTTAALGTTGSNLPSASRPLGVPAPTNTPSLAATGTPTPDAGSEVRVYVYTFVTDNGEESAPSAPGTITITAGQGVNITGMQTTATNGAVLATKRIYRAQRGAYLFVAEVPAATTSYADSVASANLGEALPSGDWDMPPAAMTALTGGANGMMAALNGYSFLLCEPFRPHAWPQKYAQAMNYPGVGIGHFGSSFVIPTTGFPYVYTASHPSNPSMAPAEFYQPCVSKRSIVSTGGDVIWASPEGLVSLGQSPASVLTKDIFTPEQWQALVPSTITGNWNDGWYVGSYNPGTGIKSFMFRPATQEWVDLPSIAATAMYRDTVTDSLYLCVGDRIKRFRAGADLNYRWKSQEAVSPLTSWTAARVTGSYPVTFKLHRNGVLAFTKTVDSDEPFKLPDTLGRSWAIELSGNQAVLGVAIATAEQEL